MSERILLPIDVRNCPLDVFPLVNGLASRPGIELTLLHIVTLSVLPPESRIYDELLVEGHFYLERLAKEYLPAVASPRLRVRIGIVVEEVLAETNTAKTDLIILPTHGPSFWQRVVFLWKHPLHPLVSDRTRQIMDRAKCGLFIALTRGRFDCEQSWGRPVRQKSDGS